MQQVFTNIPLLKHTGFIVQVLPDTLKDYHECMWPGCSGMTYVPAGDGDVEGVSDEVFLCECCGGWFCGDHFDDSFFCEHCDALAPAIRTLVIEFRTKLNELR